MTYSIGFRAPSRADLIESWSAHVADGLPEEERYTDAGLSEQANPGEITAPALARLHAMVSDALADRDAFARWFGTYNSMPKYADAEWRPEAPIGHAAVQDLLARSEPLTRNPASRFTFIRQEGQALCLFVDGQSFDCGGDAATVAEQICAETTLIISRHFAASVQVVMLVAALIDQGSLAFEEDC